MIILKVLPLNPVLFCINNTGQPSPIHSNNDKRINTGDNITIKTKAINLSGIVFLIYVLILPVFGKAIDYQESIIFYGLPFFFFLNLFSQTKNKYYLPTKHNVIIQIALIILFIISTFLSINPGTSYYTLFTFITVLLIFNLSAVYITDLETFFRLIIVFSCIYASILIGARLHLFNIPVKPVGDNFILQIWGHSYLADLLIFPLIIIISKINSKNRFITLTIVLFFPMDSPDCQNGRTGLFSDISVPVDLVHY